MGTSKDLFLTYSTSPSERHTSGNLAHARGGQLLQPPFSYNDEKSKGLFGPYELDCAHASRKKKKNCEGSTQYENCRLLGRTRSGTLTNPDSHSLLTRGRKASPYISQGGWILVISNFELRAMVTAGEASGYQAQQIKGRDF